jgi:membrane protein DedA with SNARE-associated domain
MHLMNLIHTLINDALPHLWLLPLAIISATLLLEDGTTILVGVLASDGLIPIPIALASLYIGIILGDCFLYLMGYLAADHRWARWFVKHEKYEPLRIWLEARFESAVFTSRFLPGMRIPTFAGSGFFKLPFKRFLRAVVAATIIWSTLFFTAAYLFGNLTARILGHWRWPFVIVIVLLWFVVMHWYMNRRQQSV